MVQYLCLTMYQHSIHAIREFDTPVLNASLVGRCQPDFSMERKGYREIPITVSTRLLCLCWFGYAHCASSMHQAHESPRGCDIPVQPCCQSAYTATQINATGIIGEMSCSLVLPPTIFLFLSRMHFSISSLPLQDSNPTNVIIFCPFKSISAARASQKKIIEGRQWRYI